MLQFWLWWTECSDRTSKVETCKFNYSGSRLLKPHPQPQGKASERGVFALFKYEVRLV